MSLAWLAFGLASRMIGHSTGIAALAILVDSRYCCSTYNFSQIELVNSKTE